MYEWDAFACSFDYDYDYSFDYVFDLIMAIEKDRLSSPDL